MSISVTYISEGVIMTTSQFHDNNENLLIMIAIVTSEPPTSNVMQIFFKRSVSKGT